MNTTILRKGAILITGIFFIEDSDSLRLDSEPKNVLSSSSLKYLHIRPDNSSRGQFLFADKIGRVMNLFSEF